MCATLGPLVPHLQLSEASSMADAAPWEEATNAGFPRSARPCPGRSRRRAGTPGRPARGVHRSGDRAPEALLPIRAPPGRC
ncbi:hypothetical protein GCM10010273_16000 [Streptomyces lavendulocolor]